MVGALDNGHGRNDKDDEANEAEANADGIHGLNLSGVALSSYEFAG